MTYVLWAITPEGHAMNLGEVVLEGDHAKLLSTTDLQTFGLIVTAEPYFAVTQPSDVVVAENFLRNDILMWPVPVFSGVFFALLRMPRKLRALPAWAADSARSFRDNALITVCGVIFLLHQALVSMDAIVRAVGRVLVTRRKMLEWETAAEAEAAVHPKSTVDVYLEWTPWISLALAVAIRFLRPQAMPPAAPLLALWALSWPFSTWLRSRRGNGRRGGY